MTVVAWKLALLASGVDCSADSPVFVCVCVFVVVVVSLCLPPPLRISTFRVSCLISRSTSHTSISILSLTCIRFAVLFPSLVRTGSRSLPVLKY